MMDKEKKSEVLRMRQSGMKLQEIADKIGVSKQRVYQMLPATDDTRYFTKSHTTCIYDGLRDFLNQNMWSTKKFITECGYTCHAANYSLFKNAMSGRTQFKIDLILKIMEVTGKSFEELFVNESEGEK